MNNTINNEFKIACKEFLSGVGIQMLRSYAREVGVFNPTKGKNKEDLIELIIGILMGEITPQEPSKRGAPIKNAFVDPKVHTGIEALKKQYLSKKQEPESFDFKAELQKFRENRNVLTLEDSLAKGLEQDGEYEIVKGQLETLNGVAMLLPLNCIDNGQKVLISVELIQSFDLREGDVITCSAKRRQNILVATKIIAINGIKAEGLRRGNFQDLPACYPRQSIQFYDEKKHATRIGKCLQWLIPIGKGQRGVVVSTFKAGKSTFLQEIAYAAKKLNQNVCVMAVLVDQSPENVGQFRKIIGDEDFAYTTYEDSPDRQIFVAEYILKRAKRYAECGKDVLLLLDSFNGLARAFNDTDASIGGKVLSVGLESKTVQYLKRYLGTARCIEGGGSITIIGSVAVDTGNPADNYIKAELSAIGNLEILLSDELAKRCIYPALDLISTQASNRSMLRGTREQLFDAFLRNEYLPKFGIENLLELIFECATFDEFESKVYKQAKIKK